MDIRDISCFLTASETLNFTRTAQRLYLSQQGVSRIIGKLEEELGVPLFYRRNQSLVLSEYGKDFVKTARNILQELNGFQAYVAESREIKRQTLRVAIPTGMLYSFPIKAISEYMKQYPDVDLFIKEYEDHQCEDVILSGDADLAFCVCPDNHNLKVHASHKEETYLMVSERNPLSAWNALELQQLKGEKFLSIAESNVCGGQFVRSCIECGFEPQTIFRSSDLQLIQKMCAENVGISFYVGPYPAELPGVKIVKILGEDFSWKAYLVSAGNAPLNEAEQGFVNCIRASWN
ncbi:MAG: LysR family transcriptional regulator [Faecousia sp.]